MKFKFSGVALALLAIGVQSPTMGQSKKTQGSVAASSAVERSFLKAAETEYKKVLAQRIKPTPACDPELESFDYPTDSFGITSEYDIRKTNSLVSPYVAEYVIHYSRVVISGYRSLSTIMDKNASVDDEPTIRLPIKIDINNESSIPKKLVEEMAKQHYSSLSAVERKYTFTLTFAYQKGKWVRKDFDEDYETKETTISEKYLRRFTNKNVEDTVFKMYQYKKRIEELEKLKKQIQNMK